MLYYPGKIQSSARSAPGRNSSNGRRFEFTDPVVAVELPQSEWDTSHGGSGRSAQHNEEPAPSLSLQHSSREAATMNRREFFALTGVAALGGLQTKSEELPLDS